MKATKAIRSKTGAQAHVWSSDYMGPWFYALCGQVLHSAQLMGWIEVADEDRCPKCAEALNATDEASGTHH